MGKAARPPNHAARELIAWAAALGFSWELTGKGHLAFRHPSVPGKIVASGTPRTGASHRIAKSEMRRALRPQA